MTAVDGAHQRNGLACRRDWLLLLTGPALCACKTQRMSSLLASLYPGIDAAGIAVLVAATLLGGLVRGFTGFGFAMVFMPLASLVLGPVAALGLIFVIDAPFALPLALRSARQTEWSEVVPLLVAASLAMPAGIALLVWLDRDAMRWLLALLVLGAVALLASGWRYHGKPGVPLSLGVGAASGICNGLASIGGMPLAIFWLGAQRNDRHRTRANMQSFFGLSTIVSGAILIASGIVTRTSLLMAPLPILVYGAGFWIGAHGFRLASERSFRRGAYLVIFLSAVVSLPLWDAAIGR